MEIIQKAKRLNPESAESILIKGDVEVSLEAAKEVLTDCFVKPSTIAKLQGKWSLIC